MPYNMVNTTIFSRFQHQRHQYITNGLRKLYGQNHWEYWVHNNISRYIKDKLVIVSSNVKEEYDFCEEVISIADYK